MNPLIEAQTIFAQKFNAVIERWSSTRPAVACLKPIDMSIFETDPTPDDLAEMDSMALRGTVTEALAPKGHRTPFWSEG